MGAGWVSLSSAFTQTRRFRPDGVKILFLIATQKDKNINGGGDCGELGNAGKIQKKVRSLFGGKSLSSAFTQTRLFWPDGVKILFLMLTYLSTLRSKAGFCLVRPKNAYFANSLNTSHRPRYALASLRKVAPRPAFDRSQ